MLVTIDKIRKSLNIASNDTAKDTLLKQYELIAKNWIETYCDQNIESITKDIYFDGIGYKYIFTNIVQTVNSVSYKRDLQDEWVLMTENDYTFINFNGGRIVFESNMSGYYLKANVTLGYSVIPNLIQNITLEIINHLFNQYENQTVGQNSKSNTLPGGQSVTIYNTDLTDRHKSLLNPFRKISI
jgi:hypothetical protein